MRKQYVILFFTFCLFSYTAGSESISVDHPKIEINRSKALVIHTFKNLKADTLLNINVDRLAQVYFRQVDNLCGVRNAKLSTPRSLYWIKVDEKGNWQKIKQGWIFNGISGHRIYLKLQYQ